MYGSEFFHPEPDLVGAQEEAVSRLQVRAFIGQFSPVPQQRAEGGA